MKGIAKTLALKLDLSEAQALEFLQETLEEITVALLAEHRLRLGDFGIFEIKRRCARMGRNPRTGDKLKIPSRLAVTFRPGIDLRDRVSQLQEPPEAASE